MPRKEQGWITFQSSPEERQILEQHCQQSQRSKTEILRELVRSLNQSSPSPSAPQKEQEGLGDPESERLSQKGYKAMKLSARNVLKGTVKQVIAGAVNTEVTLEISPGVEIISIITRASAEELGLVEGKEAYAVVKASNVMVAVD